jgi:sugar/nucleoside kinase (ribokinase family)
MGFDAFIDEEIRVVENRHTPHRFDAMETIAAFGSWVSSSAGRSGLREVVSQEVNAGGCSLNMGDGLASMGFPISVYSGMGASPAPVFAPFIEKCHRHVNLGIEPGRTTVAEFDDGKLMFCYLSHLAQLNADYMRTALGDGSFRAECQKADALVFTTWSVFPFLTEVWECLVDEILKGIPNRPYIFFDLADPASRTTEDLREVLQVIARFETIGKVVLSLNGNEADQVATVLGLPTADESTESLEQLASAIRQQLNITEVGIHLIKSATAATATEARSVIGPYCPKPVKSVGAGDRFNAGYLAGLLLDGSVEERLRMGCASSGFFVRNGISATFEDLTHFLTTW